MNWNKCMKQLNCKVCSDYNYCKDDIVEKVKINKKKNKKPKKKEKVGDTIEQR